MPGASVTHDYGEERTHEWVFTYATRLAWHQTSPTWSIVGAKDSGTGVNIVSTYYAIIHEYSIWLSYLKCYLTTLIL